MIKKSDRNTKISKFLSYHLRHHPEELGLTIKTGGWVNVAELLENCQKNNFTFTLSELIEVVNTNEKKRFSFNENMTKIKANQGHSMEINLQLTPQTPPKILYHGTYDQVLTKIRQEGLQKMSRHHVHLSVDLLTAKKVGQRRGKPVIFEVNAQKMSEDGLTFYCSDNRLLAEVE